MNILVTGGAGFIGSNLVDSLIKANNKVFVIDNLSSGKKRYVNPKAIFYNMDFCKAAKILNKHKIDLTIHCAAQTDVRDSIEDPLNDCHQNIQKTVLLLESIRKSQSNNRIIFLSSGGALYDQSEWPSSEKSLIKPLCPYGISKYAVEQYLDFYSNYYGFNTTVLRLANVYGPRNEKGVISIFNRAIKKGKPITVYGGGQMRDYIHVQDVIDAIYATMCTYGTFNVGTCVATSLNVLVEMICEVHKTSVDIKKNPYIKGEVMKSTLLCKKIAKEAGWIMKITIQEGLKML